MTRDIQEGACAALSLAASDPELRVVILTGAGKAFCAGGDVKGMAGQNSKGNTAKKKAPAHKHRCRGVGPAYRYVLVRIIAQHEQG